MAVEDVTAKRCGACGCVKPLDQFHKNKSRKDGRNSHCKECATARACAWQKANKDRRKEIRARWTENNLEQMRAIRNAWKRANPDKVREERAAWMRAHPEVRAANESRRRARKLGAGGTYTVGQIENLYALQKGMCAICAARLGDKYHRDHVMPLALGGTNDIGNIQLLCKTCNCRKGAKHPVEHAQQIGRLL